MTQSESTEIDELPAPTWIGVVVASFLMSMERRMPGLLAEMRKGLTEETERLSGAPHILNAQDLETNKAFGVAITWLGEVEHMAKLAGPIDLDRSQKGP